GLWPGRRWRTPAGTERAMRIMENVQLDPLAIVARAQDLALAGRVVGYRPDDWMALAYRRRRFFEWGGWLALRPMDELPFYRVLMRRERDGWWPQWAAAGHGPAIEEMRAILHERPEVANRDFAIADRARVNSYRGRKDSSVALHYLWRTGEAMVTRRERFERVYARSDLVAPAALLGEASDAETDEFLLMKAVAAAGLTKLNGAQGMLLRPFPPRDAAAWKRRQVAEGSLVDVEIEGVKLDGLVALASDLPILDALAAGRVPRAWKPLESTTTDEVTFLSPLDPVIHDRERTRRVFDFDYKWGVYDKVEKRKFGYYDLPILWGDRLVGRMDAALDRTTMTLLIKGLWYEDEATRSDKAFASALDNGLVRLADFVGAS
ncbi:MAG: uncharacterized protein HW391_1806, partial [Chloroflexi bacterium]|nr:uncharacterized protein [Chloroflexota bacterium]